MSKAFNYSQAFSRNLGLIDNQQQEVLRNTCVAIAGCGGVGSNFAHSLARLGVGQFILCDPDVYEIGNFNRQSTATMQSLNQNKASSTAEVIRSINPEAEIQVYETGLNAINVDQFIQQADLVLDGLDFFELDCRRALYKAGRRQHKTIFISAPLGLSATFHAFDDQSLTFDEYFGVNDKHNYAENLVNFLVGLAPSALHRHHMSLDAVEPETGRGPSCIVGVQQASCLVTAGLMQLLFYPERLTRAPDYLQFDNMSARVAKGRLNHWSRCIMQRTKAFLVRRHLQHIGLYQKLEQLHS